MENTHKSIIYVRKKNTNKSKTKYTVSIFFLLSLLHFCVFCSLFQSPVFRISNTAFPSCSNILCLLIILLYLQLIALVLPFFYHQVSPNSWMFSSLSHLDHNCLPSSVFVKILQRSIWCLLLWRMKRKENIQRNQVLSMSGTVLFLHVVH